MFFINDIMNFDIMNRLREVHTRTQHKELAAIHPLLAHLINMSTYNLTLNYELKKIFLEIFSISSFF